MFFFARKDFPCGVRNRMQDKILFRQLRFSLFSSARFFDIYLRMFLSEDFKHWFRKDIHYSVFSSRLHLDFGCATFLDDFPCWFFGFIVMKPGPNVEQRRQNTSLYTWSRPGVQASLRQMTVDGTENSWAKLEQAGLVYL